MGAVLCALALGVVTMAACGSSSDSERGEPSPASDGATAFRGCGPSSVAAHFAGFLGAVSERHREAALGYIAPAQELLGFTLYRWAPPRGGREDGSTPLAVYESFAKAIEEGESTTLLAVEVGDFGPFSGEYREWSGASSTSGVEAVVRIGADVWLSGKYGIDCRSGRIYGGAMNTRGGLRPQRHCGEPIRSQARKPVICTI